MGFVLSALSLTLRRGKGGTGSGREAGPKLLHASVSSTMFESAIRCSTIADPIEIHLSAFAIHISLILLADSASELAENDLLLS